MTELAAVVVNYNSGDYLRRCLASIEGSAGSASVEVVVVDNASVDGSARVAVEAGPAVRLISNARNRGFATAANQGIVATTAPYVFLLNPDAEITGGTLDALIKVGEERPRAGAIGVLVRNTDGTIQWSARKVPSLAQGLGHAFVGPVAPNNRWSRAYTMADWDRASERAVEWVSGSAVLLRRAAMDEVGGFDEGYFMYVEDVDLCTRLRAAGWEVLFSPELEVVHVTGGSSRTRFRSLAFEHSRSIYRYFSTHRARGPAVLLKPFVRVALWLRALLVGRGAAR